MLDPMCVYKTPCGWCSKFDKECDNKIPKKETAQTNCWLSQNQIEAIFNEYTKE